jgi:hypothetical protein
MVAFLGGTWLWLTVSDPDPTKSRMGGVLFSALLLLVGTVGCALLVWCIKSAWVGLETEMFTADGPVDHSEPQS